MSSRRKHHKLAQFPPEVVAAVNDLLTKGVTYDQIVEFLGQRGHEIGKSSVARYAKDFAARLERVRVVRDQLRAVAAEVDQDPLAMQDATTQVALHLIAEHLMRLQDLDGANPVQLMRALAHLQSSSVQVSKWREEQSRRVRDAASAVGDKARKAGLSEEVIREIEERVLGIAA